MEPEVREEGLWSSRTHPVQEDMSFQRGQWIVERIGWCSLYLVIVLALAGLFSIGPMSASTLADSGQHLQMKYQRFHRNEAQADMTLYLQTESRQQATLRFSTAFMAAFVIEDLRPQASQSRSSHDGVEFDFDASQSRQFPVYLTLRPRQIGLVRASVSLDEKDELPFNLFIYP